MNSMYKFLAQKRTVATAFLLLMAINFVPQFVEAQVVKPFTQRQGVYSGKTMYSIKGDYTMVGNTNLKLSSYNPLGSNNANMDYVDIDGDPATVNSSVAHLSLPTGIDSLPASCSEIVFAGLYWSGRAHDGSSANTFTVNRSSKSYALSTAASFTVTTNGVDGATGASATSGIFNTNYLMTVTRNPASGGNATLTYKFFPASGDTGKVVEFIYPPSNGAITLVVNGISLGTYNTTNTSNSNRTFSTPYVIYNNSDGTNLTITGLARNDNSSNANGNQVNAVGTLRYMASTNVAGTGTVALDKSVVLFKHESAGGYTTVSADDQNFTQNILYRNNGDVSYIYAAYREVTDYVKQYGIGNYTVANIALNEGNGGSTGFCGGWGLVVIYENGAMNWKDITVFDGYGYVGGSNNYDLPVSGFRTAQAGPVKMKLGLMASEGDVSIPGDQFSILPHGGTNNWEPLYHSGNTASNFFNSSIKTGGNPRNPYLSNNSGVDLAMFEVPNAGNSIIVNNQTSTTFRFGSTQDVYSIYCIVMGVDAYVPDAESNSTISSVTDSNGVPILPKPDGSYEVTPGATINYSLNIMNRGSEPINNFVAELPISYVAGLVPGSLLATYSPGITGTPSYTFQPSLGPSGTIVWNIGHLPLISNNKDSVLANLKYSIKVTNNCNLLTSSGGCVPGIVMDGSTSGVGANTGAAFSGQDLVHGYKPRPCQAIPNPNPEIITVNAAGICTSSEFRTITTCKTGDTVSYSIIADNFPVATRFYNEVDGAGQPATTATEYTPTNPFRVGTGAPQFYYAIPAGSASACFWKFNIDAQAPPTFTLANDSICKGDTINLMTRVVNLIPTTSLLTFYTNPTVTNAVPLVGGLPKVAPTAASTLYYAQAQIMGTNCFSPIVPITIATRASATIANIIDSVCSGTTYTRTPTATGGNIIPAVTTYKWNAPALVAGISGLAAGTGSSFTATLSNSNATTTNVVYTVTPVTTVNGVACNGTPFTITVRVKPLPTTPIPANLNVCRGNNINIRTTVGTGTYNFYRTATGGTPMASTTIINVTGDSTYWVAAVLNGCESPRVQFRVFVRELPAKSLIVQSPVTRCGTGTLVLKARPQTIGDTVMWFATRTGGAAVGKDTTFTTPVLTVVGTNPTQAIYYVEVVSQYGCMSPLPRDSVIAIANPIADSNRITAPNVTICTGNAGSLTASSTGITNPVYRWYASQTSSTVLATGATFNAGTHTAVLTRDTVFYVTVSGTNACENLVNNRKSVRLTINQTPTLSLAANTNACVGIGTTITPTITGSQPGSVTGGSGYYEWFRNGVTLQGDARISPNGHAAGPGVVLAPTYVYTPIAAAQGDTIKLLLSVNMGACGYVTDSVKLFVEPLPILNVSIESQPQFRQPLCEDTSYIVKVKINRGEGVEDVKVTFIDNNASVITVDGAAMAHVANPTAGDFVDLGSPVNVTAKETTWQIPTSTTFSRNDSLYIKFTVTPNCDYFSGGTFDFRTSATAKCPTYTIAPKAATSEALLTTQDTATLTFDIVNRFSHYTATSQTGDTVTWRAVYYVRGAGHITDSARETMVFLVPKGLNVILGSYVPVRNMYPITLMNPPITDDFGTEYSMPAFNGAAEGDSLIAELKFTTTGTPCGNYLFYNNIYYVDSAECGLTPCGVNQTRGESQISFDVERYKFTLASVKAHTQNNLWYGDISVVATTKFYAGDTIPVTFMLDMDNNTKPEPGLGDIPVKQVIYVSENKNIGDTIHLVFDSVPVMREKQLLAVINSKFLCEPSVVPIVVVLGADTICQGDTSSYFTADNMINYSWNIVRLDAVSGPTPPVRIALEGSTVGNYNDENEVRVIWPGYGRYEVKGLYTLPAGMVGPNPYTLNDPGITNLYINRAPELVSTAADTTICAGNSVELSHFFRDTASTINSTLRFYEKLSNGDSVLIGSGSNFTVRPDTTTHYIISAVSEIGCECLGVLNFTINVNEMPKIATIIPVQPTCNVLNKQSGKLYISVSGGSGEYYYSMNGINYADLPVDDTIRDLEAGSYRVYIKDKVQTTCSPSISDWVTLSTQDVDFDIFVVATPATACSANDGTIQLTTGGDPTGYYYYLNGDSVGYPAGGLFTNLAPGKYSVLAKEVMGCNVASSEVEVTVNPGFTINQQILSSANCAAEGSLRLSVSGGVAPYSYRVEGEGWKSLLYGTFDTIAFYAGTFEGYVKDATNCEQPFTFTMPNTTTLAAQIDGIKNLSCSETTGSVTIAVQNAVGTLNYNINDGGGWKVANVAGGIFTITNLPEANYTINLRDANNCTYELTARLTKTKASDIQIGSHFVTDATTCGGTNGSIQVEVTGGSGVYEYSTNGIDFFPFPADKKITNLAPHTYVIRVREASAACPAVQSKPISVGTSNSALEVEAVGVDAPACGGDGQIQIAVTGGVRPYTYRVVEPGPDGQTSAEGGVEGVLNVDFKAGNYVVIVTDASGCVETEPVVVGVANGISLTTQITAQPNCDSAGIVQITAGNGTQNYSWRFVGGAWIQFAGTTANITNLKAGHYEIEVKDITGCTTTGAFDISNTANNLAFSNIEVKDAGCDGTNGGSISLTISQTPERYNYLVTLTAKNQSITINSGDSKTVRFDNLASGFYNIVVRDGNGCTYEQKLIEVGVRKESGLVLGTLAVNTQPTCETALGSIQMVVTGGSGNYEYRIHGETDFKRLPVSQLVGYDSVNNKGTLPAGAYRIYVRDAAAPACPADYTNSLTLEPSGNDKFIAHAEMYAQTATCTDSTGSVKVIVGGGKAPYSYAYRRTIDAVAPLVYQPLPADHILRNLPAGGYWISVKDANGCVTPTDLVVVYAQNGPVLTLTQEEPGGCTTGGKIKLEVIGGEPLYSYILDETYFKTFVGNTVTIPDVQVGSHILYLIDGRNCITSGTIEIKNGTNPIPVLVDKVTNALCDGTLGGSITFKPVGATFPAMQYTYNNKTPINVPAGATEIVVSNLPVGFYDFKFTETGTGCTVVLEDIIIEKDPNANITIQSIYVLSQPGCGFEATPGSIKVVINGGSGNYLYALNSTLDQNKFNVPSTGIIDGIGIGEHTIYIWDATLTGCSEAVSNTIKLLPNTATLNVKTTVTPAATCASTDGTIQIDVTGEKGQAQYSVRLQDSTTGTAYANVPLNGNIGTFKTGEYIITVQDTSGCFASAKATVTSQNENASVSLTQLQAANCANNAQLQIALNGTNPNTSYYQLDGTDWRPFMNDTIVENVTAGWHKVMVRDNQGCIGTDTIVITNTSGSSVTFLGAKSASCKGLAGGEIQLQIVGSASSYSYSYTEDNSGVPVVVSGLSAGTVTIPNLSMGTYFVTVTDNTGCIITREKIVIDRGTQVLEAISNTLITYKNKPADGNLILDDYDYNLGAIIIKSNTQPKNGIIVVDMANGDYIYTPKLDFIGLDTLEYTIQNECGFTSNALVYITVLDNDYQNIPPVAVEDNYTTAKDIVISIMDIVANDMDSKGISPFVVGSLTQLTNVKHGTLTNNGDGTFLYAPNAGYVGTDEFEYQICDTETGLCDNSYVFISVYPNNVFADSIIAVIDAYTTARYDTLRVNVANGVVKNDNYPTAETPTVTLIQGTSNGDLTLNSDGSFTYIPSVKFAGNDVFTYQLCTNNPDIACDTAIVSIFVQDLNCPDTVKLVMPDTLFTCIGSSVNLYDSIDFVNSEKVDTAFFYTDRNYINQLADNNVTAQGWYYAKAWSVNECEDFDSVFVFVKAYADSVNIAANNVVICTDTSATLRASATVASGIINPVFRWYASQTSTTVLATADSLVTGNLTTTSATTSDTVFYVSVEGDNYCENDINKRRPVTVTIQQMPVLSMSGNLDVCMPGTVTINTSLSGGVVGDYYGWYNPHNGALHGATNFTIAPNITEPTSLPASFTFSPRIEDKGTVLPMRLRVNTGVCGYIENSVNVTVLPLPVKARMDIVSKPTGLQELCTDTSYVVKIATDTGSAGLHGMIFSALDKFGSMFKVDSIALVKRLTGSDTAWKPISDVVVLDTLNTNKYIWTLPDGGDLAAADSILIKITASAGCGFFSGPDRILEFQLDATQGCAGNLIAITPLTVAGPGYLTVYDTAARRFTATSTFHDIKGIPVSYNPLVGMPTIHNMMNDTIIWRTVYRILNDDYGIGLISVIVPTGFDFLDTVTVQNAQFEDQNPIGTAGEKITFNIPENLTTNDSVVIEYMLTSAPAACEPHVFYNEIFRGIKVPVCPDDPGYPTDSCFIYLINGSDYDSLFVMRYAFAFDSASKPVQHTEGNLWFGDITLKALTPIFPNDTILINFYIDMNGDAMYNGLDGGDVLTKEVKYVTPNVAPGAYFTLHFDNIPIVPGKQLIAHVDKKRLCAEAQFPISVIAGPDTLCQGDTVFYTGPAGMTEYSWSIRNIDAVTGATPYLRTSTGETGLGHDFTKDSVIGVIYRGKGDFQIELGYNIRNTADSTYLYTVTPSLYNTHVDPRPVIALATTKTDTTICVNSKVELSHFFHDTVAGTNSTLSFYEKVSGTLIGSGSNVIVEPAVTTVYYAAATSAAGCDAYATVDFTVIVNRGPMISQTSVSQQPNCSNNAGRIQLVVTGGSGSYQYSLNGTTFSPLQPSQIIPTGTTPTTGLAAGDYTVYVRDASATNVCNASISQPISLTAANSNLSAKTLATDVSTCSASDGAIQLLPEGGIAPYRFALRNDAGARLDSANVPANGIIGTNLPAGKYHIMVYDSAGCKFATDETTLKTINGINLAWLVVDSADCKREGTIDFTLSNGTKPYSWKLDNFGWRTLGNDTNYMLAVRPGTHTLRAKDAAGCETFVNVTMPQRNSDVKIDSIITTPAGCDGTTGGSIALHVSGTNTPLYYSINNGASYEQITTSPVIISNLAKGSYGIRLIDNDSCIYDANNIEITTDKASALLLSSISVIAQPASCTGNTGSINVAVTGGSGNYVYNFTGNPATITVLPLDGTISGLAANSYTVYVWDATATACATSVSNSIILSSSSSDLQVTATATPATSCGTASGSIHLIATGGQGKIQYRLDNAGAFADIPAGGIIPATSGKHIVYVQDTTSCIARVEATVEVMPSVINANLQVLLSADCNANAKMLITTIGSDNQNIKYYRLDGQNPVALLNDSAIVDVTAGWHKVIVTDIQGCITSDSINVPNNSGLALALAGTTQAPCSGTSGGSITLNISGGTAPYTYSYTNDASGIPVVNNAASAGNVTIADIATGVYKITVTDANGCVATYEKITIEKAIDFVKAVNDYATTYKNQSVSGNLFDNDYEHNLSPIHFVTRTGVLNGSLLFSAATGAYTYTPNTNIRGRDSLSYTIANACGVQSTAWLYITILDTTRYNYPPVALPDHYITKVGTPIDVMNVRVNDNDPHGDTLTIPTVTQGVANGTLTPNGDGTFHYMPNPDFVGVDGFSYEVCNEYRCALARVTITVYPEAIFNDSIKALPDTYIVDKYDTLKVTTKIAGILNNDIYPINELPTITVLQLPSNGALSMADSGKFTYIPNLHYYGPDYYIYSICSSNPAVGCDTTIVNITVTQGLCPDVVLPVMADTLTICQNDSVDLYTAIDFVNSENVDTVLFYTNRAHTALLANNIVKAQGWYYAKALSIHECEAFDSVFVQVNRYATASDITAYNDTICYNTETTLIASSSLGGTFKWYANADKTGGVISNTNTLSTGLLTSDSTFYVSVSNDTICENLSGTLKAVLVKVNRYAVAADITADNDTICYGAPATLAVSSPKGTIKWYAENDPSGTPLHIGDTLTTTKLFSDTVFYVSVQNDTFCQNQEGSLKEVRVIVNAIPVVSLAAIDLCANTTGEIVATTNATMPIYSWSCTQDMASVYALLSDSSHAIVTPNADSAGVCVIECCVVDRATGCENTYTQSIQINTAPISGFSYTASPSNSFDIQFTDESTIASGNIVSRSWDFGDGNTSTDQDPTNTYALPGKYDVTLVVTTDSSCTETIMQTLDVAVGLVPNFNIDDSVLCFLNNSFVFTDASTINAIATDTAYFWAFGDGETSTEKDATHSYSISGTYDVKLVVSLNGGAIQDSITKQVTVKPTPVLTNETNAGSICSGDLFEYNAVSSVALSNISWSRAAVTGINANNTRIGVGSLISEQLTSSMVAPINVVYTFAMIADGCSSSDQTVTVTVNPLPQVSAMPAGAYMSVTGTDTVAITDNNTNANRSISIVDTSIADANFDLTTNLIRVTGKKKGNTEIVYTTINEYGCETKMIIPVQVEGRPTGILTGKDIIVCNEPGGVDEIVQIAYIMGGVAPWHVVISDDRGNSYDTTINALDDLPVNVKVKVPENISDVPQFTNYTITLVEDIFNANRETHYGRVRIGLNPTPRIDDIANKYQTVCAGELTLPVSFKGISTLFSTSVDKNIGTMNYSKDGIESFIAINNGTQLDTATIIVTPEYWYNTVVCMGEPDTAFIIVSPKPQADFSMQLIGVATISFTDLSVGAVSYAWNFGDGRTSTDKNPVHTYAQSNTYTVTLTVTNSFGCTSTISKQIAVSTTTDLEAMFNVAPAVQCLGNSFTFYNTSKISTLNHRISNYLWSFGDGATAVTKDAAHSYTNAGTYTVTLTVTEAPGGTQSSYSQVVTVLGKPVVALATPEAVCEGSKLSVTAPVIDWRGNAPEPGTWLLNGVIFDLNTLMTATDNGKLLQYRVTSVCGDTGSIAVPITVRTSPVMSNILDAAYCSGTQVPAMVFAPAGATYQWNQRGGSIGLTTISGMDSIPAFTATNTSSQAATAYFEVTPLNGTCKGSTISYSVTVNPEIKLMGSLRADSLCSNNMFEYVAASTTPNVSCMWSRPAIAGINNGAAKSGNGAAISELLVNNTATAIEVTYNIALNQGNCSNTETVTVVVKPAASVTLTAETKACQDETVVNIGCENNIPGLPVYYKISYDAKSLESGFQNMPDYVLLTGNSIEVSLPIGLTSQRYAGTVSVKTIDCPNGTTYNFGITIGKATKILEQPVSRVDLCEGDEASISLSVKAEGSSLKYQWYFNGYKIAGATQPICNMEAVGAYEYGAYTVEVEGDCGTVVSNASKVQRNDLMILQKWGTVLFVSGRDSVTGSEMEYKTYQWYRIDASGNMVAIAENANVQYYTKEGISGTFVVKAFYADGTYRMSCPYTIEKITKTKVSIYPNPAKSAEKINVLIDLGGEKVEGAKIEVYDILGRQYASVAVSEAQTEVRIDASPGTYIFRITDPKGKVTIEKVVIK